MSDEKVQSDYIFDTASDEEAAKFRLSPHLINLMSDEPFFSSLIIKFAVPSAVFKAIFPVKPSVIITLV